MTESNPTSSGKSKSDPSKSTAWQDWVSRTTAVFAVLAALSSGTWGASNLRAILEQGKVNDTWAYFQAASIKGHGAEQMQELVKGLGKGEPEERSKTFAALEATYNAEKMKQEAKKDAVYKLARQYEASRNKMVERGFWFEISFICLQVAVILCTIAGAAKNKTLLITAVIFSGLGLAVLANGFLFLKHAPKALYESAGKDMASDAGSENVK